MSQNLKLLNVKNIRAQKRGYFVVTPVLLIVMIGQYDRYYCISRYG